MEPKLDSGDAITDVEFDAEENQPEKTTPSRWAGLGTRAASGIVLGAIFLAALWQGGWIFTWLTLLCALMMAREWNTLTEDEAVVWRIAGLFYVTIPCASLIWLRNVHFTDHFEAGRALVLFVVLAVVATDVGAYFTGRAFGKRKLAPLVSPNKTWEGLAGGVVAAAAVSAFSYGFSPYPTLFLAAILWGAVLALLGQGGDLLESYIKRRSGTKDSGTLLPGHGGLLDRVDGLVFTIPAFAWCVWLSGMSL